MKPRIFISNVSAEFKTVGQMAANILTRLGYEPEWQETFGTEAGDLRRMLRKKIESCEGLVQIVGYGYGAEPPQELIDPEFGRVSYTQYEFLYAQKYFAQRKNRRTWLIYAGDDCTRDTPLERLDLPRDPHDADPSGYQAERRELQEKWRARWQGKGETPETHLRHSAKNDIELSLCIERMKDELSLLRGPFRRWQITVIVLLLCLIGGVGLIAVQQYRNNTTEKSDRQNPNELSRKYVEILRVGLLTDKEPSFGELRERAIRELAQMDSELSMKEIVTLIDQDFEEAPGTGVALPVDRMRHALAQGKLNLALMFADEIRQSSREAAMLEGTIALAKFRESPALEWNQRALTSFERAVASADKETEPGVWAEAAIAVAATLADHARFDEAETLIKEVIEIRESVFGKQSHEVADALNIQGMLLRDTDRLDEAEEVAWRAISIEERLFGKEHFNVATSLAPLAQVLQDQGKLSEAYALNRKILEAYEKELGPETAEVATCLNNLAQVLVEQGQLTEAQGLLRRALAIDGQALGVGHPDFARDLSNLGQLLDDSGRSDLAEGLMLESLSIWETSLGPSHPHVALGLNNLAAHLMVAGRFSEAEMLFRRSILINERVYVPWHSTLSVDCNNFGELLAMTNRSVEAEPLLLRALTIDMKMFGTNHPEVAGDLNNLAVLLIALERFENLEALLRLATEIDEANYGPTHPIVASDLNNLAQILRKENRLREAAQVGAKAVQTFRYFEEENGFTHPRFSATVANLQMILIELEVDELEIERRVAEASSNKIAAEGVSEFLTALLGPVKSLKEVLGDLDRLVETESVASQTAIALDLPVSSLIDELVGPSNFNPSLDEPVSSRLRVLLGASKSFLDSLQQLDLESRSAEHTAFDVIPLNVPISPHLDELLGPALNPGS